MNTIFTDVLLQQTSLHPSFTPQDALKLSYQAAFGAEHLLLDTAHAQIFLMEEYATMLPFSGDVEPLVEEISSDFCRVNLRIWKEKHLPIEWLFYLFCQSSSSQAFPRDPLANPSQPTDPALLFHKNLIDIDALCAAGALPFLTQDWKEALVEYQTAPPHPVHHSAPYRAAEAPAYRLIHKHFLPLLPLLEKINALPQLSAEKAIVLAIDGRCGSGKTTLANALCALLKAQAIQMDSFFLPPDKRTAERLATPGGNIEIERFAEEVLPHLGQRKDFSYQRFSCASMQLADYVEIAANKWQIVEGSYSHHPALGKYADLRIFVTIAPQAQIIRICARNGEEWAKEFKEKWIPMEEAYFTEYSTQQKADIIL